MTTQTDPTYLRYIFDGLESKAIHQENISALPEGLIGIYEEALSQEHNVRDRERFLSFFSTWALLKKEVNAFFIVEILNWHEQEIIDNLSIYTKWFNSPTSGTYILYHERLRVFLLEKISPQKLHFINEKIISLSQKALEQKKGDEWEVYALEHLSAHLMIPAMHHEQDGINFKKLVYDTGYWNRQVEISKGYDWSKRMLNLAMVWAAKQNTDELIECALNKVDLHYMEQNDAPRIVELVAQNDIDTALQRIEAFGGNDKEGLQRKFTLYMLCLMELTLLDSKDKPFRKSAIEKILSHLDENIPVDHSLLNWNDFFSSYLIFKMACELAKIELDYFKIYIRTDSWESDWIEEMIHFTIEDLNLLLKVAHKIIDERDSKTSVLVKVSNELLKLELIHEALEATIGMSDNSNHKTHQLLKIISRFAVKGNFEEALQITNSFNELWSKDMAFIYISIAYAKHNMLEEAKYTAERISDEREKKSTLGDISKELARQGKLFDSLEIAGSIGDDRDKYAALEKIVSVLAELGIIDESLKIIYSIADKYYKSSLLLKLAIELKLKEKNNESIIILQESLETAKAITHDCNKDRLLGKISCEFSKQEKNVEAIQIAHTISDDWYKWSTLKEVSYDLCKRGEIFEALQVAKNINDKHQKDLALEKISYELFVQGKFDKSLEIAYSIVSEINKSSLLLTIAIKLKIQKNTESFRILQEALDTAYNIKLEMPKTSAFVEICSELVMNNHIGKVLEISRDYDFEDHTSSLLAYVCSNLYEKGNFLEAIEVAKKMRGYQFKRDSTFSSISIALVKKGFFEEALENVQNIYDNSEKVFTLVILANELAKQGKIKHSKNIIFKKLEKKKGISNESYKWAFLKEISTLFLNEGKISQALGFSRFIADEIERAIVIQSISNKCFKLGFIILSNEFTREALETARSITDKVSMDFVIISISSLLAKQDKFEEALETVNLINTEYFIDKAFLNISTELAIRGKYSESIETVSRINREELKCLALLSISTEYYKSGKFNSSIDMIATVLVIANNINDKQLRNDIYENICIELVKQDKVNESLLFFNSYRLPKFVLLEICVELIKMAKFEEALKILNSNEKDIEGIYQIKEIASEFIKNGFWGVANKFVDYLPNIYSRQSFWERIPERLINDFSPEMILSFKENLINNFEKSSYLKGWSKSIIFDDINDKLTYKALQALMNDSSSLEHFLQVYSQHELFFNKLSQEKIDRLNKTLNLQWALDIIAQFPKE